MQLTEDVPKPFDDTHYRVSVQLDGLEVEHPETGTRAMLNPIEINDVVGGGFAG